MNGISGNQTCEPAVLLLPRNTFHYINRLSLFLMCFVPCWFIVLKIWDRHLTDHGAHDFSWCISSGFFGKIDDLSFWIVVAGLLATRNVMKAWSSLPDSATEKKEAVERVTLGDIWKTGALILVVCGVYTAIMYPTNGTFFKPVSKEERPAQILEGLTNLFLVALFYSFLLIAHLALRRAKRLITEKAPEFGCERRKACAELLVNSPLVMAYAAVGGALLFPVVKWLGEFIYSHKHWEFFNWTSFQPEPWKEVLSDSFGGVCVALLYFLPWFLIIKHAKRLLCDGCNFRFNWIWMVPLVVTQQAPTSMLVFILRELMGGKSAFALVLKVVCKPVPIQPQPATINPAQESQLK